MVAFSNAKGGLIIIGVNDKTGALNSLLYDEIQSTNLQTCGDCISAGFPLQLSFLLKPVNANGSNIIIVGIKEGISKPYKDRLGTIYVKNGSDKRRVTSNDEIARLLQSSKVMYADELPIQGSSISDINLEYYKSFVQKKYNRSLDDLGIGLAQSLESQNLLKKKGFLL